MNSESPSVHKHRPLTIAVIGGLDRAAVALRQTAVAHGHRLEHHCGASSGPGKRGIEATIRRADLVVIVTGHNNHPAALFARTQARHHAVPSLICKRFGPAHLTRLLDGLARGTTPSSSAGHVFVGAP